MKNVTGKQEAIRRLYFHFQYSKQDFAPMKTL